MTMAEQKGKGEQPENQEKMRALQRKAQEEITELMLLQTNDMTFGQFTVSEWQDNILTLMTEQLQKHMTTEQQLQTDLFGEPYVTIACDEVGGKNHKAMVLKEARGLREKVFSYRWVSPKTHRTIETSGVIVTTIHDDKGTNNITLNFNKWAIPFLIYYGKGVGGTWFSKNVSLQLRGDKTKRLYRVICSQRDKTEFYYSIKQFREDFMIGDSYTNASIKKHILDPARDRIKESNADVWFDYEMITRYPKNNGRKPMADTIVFHIKTTKATNGTSQHERNATVHRWLMIAFDHDLFKVEKAWNVVLNSSRLGEIYNRLVYWEDQISAGNMTTPHVKNSFKKLLRDDFNLTFDEQKGKKKGY